MRATDHGTRAKPRLRSGRVVSVTSTNDRRRVASPGTGLGRVFLDANRCGFAVQGTRATAEMAGERPRGFSSLSPSSGKQRSSVSRLNWRARGGLMNCAGSANQDHTLGMYIYHSNLHPALAT
jgi:hypothetical protein